MIGEGEMAIESTENEFSHTLLSKIASRLFELMMTELSNISQMPTNGYIEVNLGKSGDCTHTKRAA
jgi:hypothetical protein